MQNLNADMPSHRVMDLSFGSKASYGEEPSSKIPVPIDFTFASKKAKPTVFNPSAQAARDAKAAFDAENSDSEIDELDDSIDVQPEPVSKKIEVASSPQKAITRANVEPVISSETLQAQRVPNILTEDYIASLEPICEVTASRFMRNHTKTAMFFHPDRDELRVTVKGTDVEEDKYKHVAVVEINVFNQHERQQKYIECAHKVWESWAAIESEKL